MVPVQVNEIKAGAPDPIQVTFLGATTLLVRCGRIALLTDGFFSRPSMKQVLLGKIAPDPGKIAAALASASITSLDAVLVGHSHYDHALDAPEVTRQTGARLVGSASTAQIGRGWGLPNEQMVVIQSQQELTVGDLTVTFIASQHSQPLLYPGEITRPLSPPARASAYREGGTYSILIASSAGSILVQESANMIPGALSGRHAEVVFLSVAQLGRRGQAFISRYFAETVLSVGAERVIPIHWDHFQKPVDQGLVPFPAWIDDTSRSMRILKAVCDENQIQFQILPFGLTTEIPA